MVFTKITFLLNIFRIILTHLHTTHDFKAVNYALSTEEIFSKNKVIYKNYTDSLRRCIFLYVIIFSWKPLIKLIGNREKAILKPFICHEHTLSTIDRGLFEHSLSLVFWGGKYLLTKNIVCAKVK